MKKLFFILTLAYSAQVQAQTSRLDSLWSDPSIEQRIQNGIEKNRKGDFRLHIPGKGKKNVEIRQISHDFDFGANGFMVKEFDTEERNERYEKVFSSLFNVATVPFYWKTTEPEQGKLRFDASSPKKYRRPAPDLVLEFCRKYGISPKGHPLVWSNPAFAIPDWLPKDTAVMARLIDKRIQQIAERYGNKIGTWDVVNEMLSKSEVEMPANYVLNAFLSAQKYFPASTRLLINEQTWVWQRDQGEYSSYNLLIENLLAKGARIDDIGLQFHFFGEQFYKDVLAGNTTTPQEVFRALDTYSKFGIPLHVSEITIPTLPYNSEGMAHQAKLTRNYYRLWFSHPSVSAIIWWNLVDGTAAKGEDKWNGGLVNNDFSQKPAFAALDQLLNKEWKTSLNQTVSGNDLNFRGFYGDYLVRIKQGGKTIEKKVNFRKSGNREVTLN
ncbi:endo-1,4-beta-xylanase [Desertivirga xinjiangensis]|uniref:endo-1,4-beta-xylanase n=1 Tax=Desertivirga xinjiangensis TaxID=539206 RepID=UPI002109FA7F|nr:endo-1,4-beta-xylanase [Pedobacter xinjiangensis]